MNDIAHEPTDADLNAIEGMLEGEQPDPLDDLWEAVVADLPSKTHRVRANPALDSKREARATISPSTYYLDSANWTRTRGVMLVHEDTESVLGNFSEYRHLTGATKLVRESALISIEGEVRVSGTWWLEPLAREHIEAAKQWHSQRHEIVPLFLDRLGVFCPAAPITLFLAFGGIMRVELNEDCKFASADGSQLLFLKAGMNVYEAMDVEGKVALRKEITL